MKNFRLYSRPGCHLCEVLLEELQPLIRGRAGVEIVDIDTREDWQSAYGTRIPVLEFDGDFVCEYRLDRGKVRALLDDGNAS